MGLTDSLKRLLPGRVRAALSRIVYPYRRGRRFFKPYVISKEMEGVGFDFYVGDRTGRDWYHRECINNPVWREMRFMRDTLIQKGDVIFECGGHHGCSAILLSRWVGGEGKIVTFEPFPSNFEILTKNIGLNNLTNVDARMEAVGAKAGTITFDEASSGISATGRGVSVKVACLDDYAHLRPTLLKVDVEGFEIQVLEGAKQILSTRPKLEIEVHAELLPQYGATVADLFGLIGSDDYRFWVQWRDDQMPVDYVPGTPITHRVHLFGIPRALMQ